MRKFISTEQQAVVEYRESMGYVCDEKPGGYYLCYKGRHTMVINGLGYDTYTGIK